MVAGTPILKVLPEYIQGTIDLLHKSKIVEGFLGETKPATFTYTARK
ncbi:hypothetical protein [Candidatus Tisiphia endosymbiont of Ptychoptera albimana]